MDCSPSYEFYRVNYEGSYKIISVENGKVNVNVQLTSSQSHGEGEKKPDSGNFDAKLDLANHYITLQKDNPLSYAFEEK
jgi:hypothetical protein